MEPDAPGTPDIAQRTALVRFQDSTAAKNWLLAQTKALADNLKQYALKQYASSRQRITTEEGCGLNLKLTACHVARAREVRLFVVAFKAMAQATCREIVTSMRCVALVRPLVEASRLAMSGSKSMLDRRAALIAKAKGA
jgi:hypothetical protein